MTDAPRLIRLKDYREPDFWIDESHLDLRIFAHETLVASRLRIRRNAASATELVLDGVDLELLSLGWNGQPLPPERYRVQGHKLHIEGIDGDGWLDSRVRIHPEANRSLEGLYRSRTMFCTQCEAEGFRKITWYLDRPDVMSQFSTRLEADRALCPVLLANGNLMEQGELDGGRHFAVWVDPFKKPSYLFALVAGDLARRDAEFVTASGRPVAIQVYVEPKDLDKCDHAIDSLQRAMRWDEQVYGREYDLDRFMIVAVDDFNMGAMENKGLNIFNTSCVLASPQTSTDAAFQRVEGVVAHEYFHNWSGNRVTCRDWFQLSLKEGFTVFRDAQFSADMNSATVKRIEDVNLLRTAQFAEDAGPLAHPVRPAAYMEISNFYTATVYEKGAELVRMLANLLGTERFRQATDLYFARHDGQAVTCDDFLAAMAVASGRDLRQFARWYSQAGTPLVAVTDHYDPAGRRYTLSLAQRCPPTPECAHKLPFHIPIRLGLLGEAGPLPLSAEGLVLHGDDATDAVLELTQASQAFVFEGIAERPVPSLLRGFSAPVQLHYDYGEAALLRLMNADPDLFNRWMAAQQLGQRAIEAALAQGEAFCASEPWLAALANNLADPDLDPALLAYMLALPSTGYLQERLPGVDILAIHAARERVRQALVAGLEQPLWRIYAGTQIALPYQPSAQQIGRRSLKNAALSLLVLLPKARYLDAAQAQFQAADNMTDQLAALRALVAARADGSEALAQAALADFFDRWRHEALVVNQWLAVQAGDERAGAVARIRALTGHEAFNWGNPNKVRSLLGAFCSQNVPGFHAASGDGYRLLADAVLQLDAANPQIAARLVQPLTGWRKHSTARAQQMRAQLARIAQAPLSPDLYEVVTKSLAVES